MNSKKVEGIIGRLLPWILTITFVCIAYFFIDAGGLISERDRKEAAERELQALKTTSRGVTYFYDCIDGNKFVVTKAGHGNVLAGPIGKCEAEE